ncbi:helix-turn-helix transcriptional regulator [Limnoglobus roseus]|uniref:DNA-binding protein n=1 Tax=Limnoglobus roseus TaxID=2598579 RepID=A0A5C1AT71_9BACT|nr:hypothetical protein [Limnoglobus roseus]QEL20404.1 DNA-binding protein [Limnoglobus roseus]
MPDRDPGGAATLDDVVGLLRELVAAARPAPALLDIGEFAALMAIGESTLERLKATPQIGPQPVRLGGSVRWNRAEVTAWLGRRNHRGELFDARTWPAVWKQIQSA